MEGRKGRGKHEYAAMRESAENCFNGLIEALMEVGCREVGLIEPTGLKSQEVLLLNVHLMVQGFSEVIQPGLSVRSQVMLSLGYHQDNSNDGFISVIYFFPTEIGCLSDL